jgi:hypothetical protein
LAPKKTKGDVEEYMGFMHKSTDMIDVSNPTNAMNAETDYNSDDDDKEDVVTNDVEIVPPSYEERQEILGEIMGEELDIKEFGTTEQFVEATRDAMNGAVTNRLEMDAMEEVAEAHDAINRAAIDRELRILLPSGNGRKSTMEAFQRLTSNCEWIPFRFPDSSAPASEMDKAEASLYDEWMSNPNTWYLRGAKTGR